MSDAAGYDPAGYGELWAEVYDCHYEETSAELAPSDAVRFIRSRAGGGPVLELGVGTGRVAIPLARGGLSIDGLDGSPAMLRRLAARDRAGLVRPLLGDMAAFVAVRRYPAVFCIFNTLLLLPTLELQASCLACVAESLRRAGAFIVEAITPEFDQFGDQPAVQVRDTPAGRIRRVTAYDPATRTLRSTYFDEAGPRRPVRHVALRCTTLEELDGIAATARLRLAERWSDWRMKPYSRSAAGHVSVYRKT